MEITANAEDVKWIASILPADYTCSPLANGVKCRSMNNIGKGNKYGIRDDDVEHWDYVMKAIRQKYGDRFIEVDHVTCCNHQHFNVYLRY